MEANITKLAKKLRKGQTDAESLLWKHLRTKQMEGVKFRRQEPIGRFIVDFVSSREGNPFVRVINGVIYE